MPSSHLFSYLPTYIEDLFLTEWVTKVKPYSNLVKVDPQFSHDEHQLDDQESLSLANFLTLVVMAASASYKGREIFPKLTS